MVVIVQLIIIIVLFLSVEAVGTELQLVDRPLLKGDT